MYSVKGKLVFETVSKGVGIGNLSCKDILGLINNLGKLFIWLMDVCEY
jgi:hypothetical protein